MPESFMLAPPALVPLSGLFFWGSLATAEVLRQRLVLGPGQPAARAAPVAAVAVASGADGKGAGCGDEFE